MSDSGPSPKSEPVLKRIDGPPKPPTKTTSGLMDGDETPREDSSTTETAVTVSSAGKALSDLLILNGGGRPEKRESLELSLDRNVILLNKLAPRIQGQDSETVARTLRDIRDYRRRFPRTEASNREQAEEARRVLDGIPEV